MFHITKNEFVHYAEGMAVISTVFQLIKFFLIRDTIAIRSIVNAGLIALTLFAAWLNFH